MPGLLQLTVSEISSFNLDKLQRVQIPLAPCSLNA